MKTLLTRRQLLAQVLPQAIVGCGVAALAKNAAAQEAKKENGKAMTIQTVLGPIPAANFGFALPHEHVMCDFIGADKTSRARWNGEEVIAAILPNLRQLKERGATGFVDCTPAYIGRDPRVLRQLAEQTGLHILTNTGYYGGAGDKFLPAHAYTESAEQLAARWIDEWKNGIEDTGIKPGFIKIGIDEFPKGTTQLSSVDAKLVQAAALTSRETSLPVTCHTGGGPAGHAAALLFAQSKGVPQKFIVAHSDGHGPEINRKIAQLGSWVSFDGIGYRPLEEHLKIVLPVLEQHAERLLLSMDSGWWNVGEPNGGKIKNYNYLSDTFLPALRQSGASDATIQQLTVANPARAFAL